MDETNANSFVNRELHSKAFICNSKVIVFDKNNSGIRHFKPISINKTPNFIYFNCKSFYNGYLNRTVPGDLCRRPTIFETGKSTNTHSH